MEPRRLPIATVYVKSVGLLTAENQIKFQNSIFVQRLTVFLTLSVLSCCHVLVRLGMHVSSRSMANLKLRLPEKLSPIPIGVRTFHVRFREVIGELREFRF